MLTINCCLNGAVNRFNVDMLVLWISIKIASTITILLDLSKIDEFYSSLCQSQRKHNMIQ